MKRNSCCCFVLALMASCVLASSAQGQTAVPGTFKHITIDGSFNDWTGVPVAYMAAMGSTNAIQYENVYIANDGSNIYLRFTLYSPRANAFANPYDNLFFDADANAGTGFTVGGIGSEMLIQWGSGYQEQNGGFNVGAINNLGWAIAGSPDNLDFEATISLGAAYASDSNLVFTNGTVAILLEGDDTSFINTEFVPPSGGLVYTLASNPGNLTTNLPLITLTNSSWAVNASGSDLGTNWLDQAYDDTQAGWSSGVGLFGYTGAPGSYPPINTALASGPSAYYFRTHFQWTNNSANIAFVVTNYLSDGAVYYVNGAEARRVRMPAGTVSYGTAATGTNTPAGRAEIFGIDGGILQSGDNIFEVETHQAPGSGADMVFGLSLTAAAQYSVYVVNTNLPGNQSALAGQSVTFTSDVIGSGPLTYQWYFNGTNAIAGASGTSYAIPLVLTNNAGSYSLAVSNSFSGATTRSALLTVSNTPVGVVTQPASVVAVEGKPATLSVVASGTPLLQYQWYRNSALIAGATNSSYALAPALLTNSGTYYVTISNPANATNSASATLTVLADTIPPSILALTVGASQITITFTEPVDATTAGDAANYKIGGVTVSGATPNPGDATQVTITTTTPLNFGTLYALTVKGVADLFGNVANTTVSFARDIAIDGSFDDWTGLTPVYSNPAPSGNTGAADFKDIYVYNDASYYYFRVTLWTDIDPGFGQFPYYVNMFFDTDNDPGTGYAAIGSEMLIQSGYSYQEKNGGFNDGVSINGLNWLCLPVAPGTNFEFRISRSATFQDATSLFTTNAFQFLFQGMTPGFVVENTVPSDGGTIGYTNLTSVVVPPLPLGKLAVAGMSGGSAAVIWDSPGTLQSSSSIGSPSWTNVLSAASPYVIPTAGAPRFFRLAQ